MVASKSSLTLIPARGGSKGIYKKNIAPINGIPMLEYTIRSSLEANLPGKICLSTDDEEIINVAKKYNIDIPFIRPESLAQDNSGTMGVIIHALNWYEENEGFKPEYLVLLQPTSPLRSAKSIIEAYKKIEGSKNDSLISVNPVREHPCEYITKNGDKYQYVMNPPAMAGRQNFPEVFFINGAIFISRCSFIQNTGYLYDEYADLYIMNHFESLDIDEPWDLELATFFLKNRKW